MENVSAVLRDRTAAVMRHHGTVVVDRSLGTAYDGARQLEWMCDVWLRARAAGEPALLSAAQVDEIVGRMADYGSAPAGGSGSGLAEQPLAVSIRDRCPNADDPFTSSHPFSRTNVAVVVEELSRRG